MMGPTRLRRRLLPLSERLRIGGRVEFVDQTGELECTRHQGLT